MKKTFACAVRPNKAPSMRRGLSIISLEHSYGLNGSRIFDRTQLAPKCAVPRTDFIALLFDKHLQTPCVYQFGGNYKVMAKNLMLYI